MGDKSGVALRWWELLGEEQQNILIELLYKLDLQDYVKMDEDGNILGFID